MIVHRDIAAEPLVAELAAGRGKMPVVVPQMLPLRVGQDRLRREGTGRRTQGDAMQPGDASGEGRVEVHGRHGKLGIGDGVTVFDDGNGLFRRFEF